MARSDSLTPIGKDGVSKDNEIFQAPNNLRWVSAKVSVVKAVARTAREHEIDHVFIELNRYAERAGDPDWNDMIDLHCQPIVIAGSKIYTAVGAHRDPSNLLEPQTVLMASIRSGSLSK